LGGGVILEEARVVGSGEGVCGGGWGLVYGRVWWLVFVFCVLFGGLCVPSLALAVAPVVEVREGRDEEWVGEVSATSVTLRAEVNAEKEPTTFRFEYDTSGYAQPPSVGHGVVVPSPPVEGDVGEGEVGVDVGVHFAGLKPDTVYYFRVVVRNAVGEETEGTGQAFTTQPLGGGSVLPDGRAWELVSPARKDGALILPIEEAGGLVQAAAGGGAITYLSNGSVGGGPSGNSNATQVLSVRGGGGDWSSLDIATPHAVATGASVGHGQEYRFFSPDLAVGLVEPFGSGTYGEEAQGAVPLSPEASEKTLYVRADGPLVPEGSEAVPYGEAEVEEGGYKALVTSKVGYADVQEGAKFGGKVGFIDATADLSHVLFVSRGVPLTAGAAEDRGLYEWSAGRPPSEALKLVSVLPEAAPYNGRQAEGFVALGFEERDVRGAVSGDGSRVVFSDEISGGVHLFMRDVLDGQTAQLDVVGGGAGGGEGRAVFQFASSDGSRVFFTDEESLLPGAKATEGAADLYECEMVEVEEAGREVLKCDLRDLTEDPVGGAGVQGVVLAGEDNSSYVYFVANGVLAGNENGMGEKAAVGDCNGVAHGGTCNLYVRHFDEGSGVWEAPVFVAGLSGEDWPDWAGGTGNLEEVSSRVPPDGEYLEFMSERSLTGYDNRDVNSGELDEEVYLYRAPGAGVAVGRLVCVSCNPTGERPAGVLDTKEARFEGLLADGQSIWGRHNRWLAGSVPGWTAISLEVARYQSRYLSDSGRVFFDSPDALVSRATDGLENVYEYEPAGVGSCEEGSGGFSVVSGGCVGLISSGTSSEESVFLDASESGGDVFFLTSAPLVAEDKDTAFDVYDAHVCSVSAPCATAAVAVPACVTAESCRAGLPAAPGVFSAPSSAVFTGAGNPVLPPAPVSGRPVTVSCSKGKRLRDGKCVKVKVKRKKRARRAGAGRSGRDRRGGR
jgi:hypothetical protein